MRSLCMEVSARFAIEFLKKEWTDSEGKDLKGGTFMTAVRQILQ